MIMKAFSLYVQQMVFLQMQFFKTRTREQTNSMKIAMKYLHKHLHAIQIITAANTEFHFYALHNAPHQPLT